MNQDFRSDECSVELLPCSDVFTTSLSASSNFCDKSSPIIRRENAWNIWFCKNCCFPVSRAPKSAEKLIDKRSFRSFWPKRKQIFDTSVRFFTSPWWFTSVSFLQVLVALQYSLLNRCLANFVRFRANFHWCKWPKYWTNNLDICSHCRGAYVMIFLKMSFEFYSFKSLLFIWLG